ncbi:MAG: hypothetical protein EBR82_34310 [Caulobacteraceae bacterium]|nr:hypothetical protein [Caulobacteraceae bacterium]
MPRKQIDYSRTVIYKIVCNDLEIKDCYVGHTTDFICRKTEHKYCCNISTKKGYNLKIYKTIRDNGGWDNWSMIEIEKYPCNDSAEARTRERYWYEILNANLNSINPNRSNLEREHTEKYKQTRKKWYENNKKKILEQKKQHLENLKSLESV